MCRWSDRPARRRHSVPDTVGHRNRMPLQKDVTDAGVSDPQRLLSLQGVTPDLTKQIEELAG